MIFCTTECWSCKDKTCEHYISKEELYFENLRLKQKEKELNELKQELVKILQMLRGEEDE